MDTSVEKVRCRYQPTSIDRWREEYDKKVLRKYRRGCAPVSSRRPWAPPAPAWVADRSEADGASRRSVSVVPGSWSTCGPPPHPAAYDERAARAASLGAVADAQGAVRQPWSPPFPECAAVDPIGGEALAWALKRSRSPSVLPPRVDSLVGRGYFSSSASCPRDEPQQPTPDESPPPAVYAPQADEGAGRRAQSVARQAAAHLDYAEQLRAATEAVERVTSDRERAQRRGTCEQLRRLQHAQTRALSRLRTASSDAACERAAMERACDALEGLRARKEPLISACMQRLHLQHPSDRQDGASAAAATELAALEGAAGAIAELGERATELCRELDTAQCAAQECLRRAEEVVRRDAQALASDGCWSAVQPPDEDGAPADAPELPDARSVALYTEGLVARCVEFRRRGKRGCVEAERRLRECSQRTQTALRHRRKQRAATLRALEARGESLRGEHEHMARQVAAIQQGIEQRDRERTALMHQIRQRRLRPFAGSGQDKLGSSMERQHEQLASAIEQLAEKLNSTALECGRLLETERAVQQERATQAAAAAADAESLELPFTHDGARAVRSLCDALCGGYAAVYGAYAGPASEYLPDAASRSASAPPPR
eukprot:TRINITY_DN3994_c0_g1_i1.p1 TRINITY_DN3994_c0_g1~~TRINITY_DN3994_c0_g1_i1.p1  ORF type:complete len:605 (+),score=172.56 TRINITY_DN3994_c0_g1_i1:60-1874(+)